MLTQFMYNQTFEVIPFAQVFQQRTVPMCLVSELQGEGMKTLTTVGRTKSQSTIVISSCALYMQFDYTSFLNFQKTMYKSSCQFLRVQVHTLPLPTLKHWRGSCSFCTHTHRRSESSRVQFRTGFDSETTASEASNNFPSEWRLKRWISVELGCNKQAALWLEFTTTYNHH